MTGTQNLLPYFLVDTDRLLGPYHLVSHVTWTLCGGHALIFVIEVSSFGAGAAVQGREPNLTGLVCVAQRAAAAAAASCVVLVFKAAWTVFCVFLCGRKGGENCLVTIILRFSHYSTLFFVFFTHHTRFSSIRATGRPRLHTHARR